ncbi:hypothetical protein P4S83_01835 [Aneurinibacillus thermoaerophilus]|uniref:hypothetical protein n=1 Tax=Aneurinibacillus thermoaerophilus TaxID=143495 RepID=UPI002E1CD1D0|nr:hypothetical protein [Aneurinibacillus thermoaerophilus]
MLYVLLEKYGISQKEELEKGNSVSINWDYGPLDPLHIVEIHYNYQEDKALISSEQQLTDEIENDERITVLTTDQFTSLVTQFANERVQADQENPRQYNLPFSPFEVSNQQNAQLTLTLAQKEMDIQNLKQQNVATVLMLAEKQQEIDALKQQNASILLTLAKNNIS